MKHDIPLFEIFSDKADVDSVQKVINSKMNWAVGPEVLEFERRIKNYIGAEHALTFNSGTSAIYAGLLAAGIGKGDEVILPAFTYVATVMPVSLVGASPVFADIENKSFGLDPIDVIKKINKKTKAIIAVHYAGMPCRISELSRIAKKNNLLLIEDAAEAFGSAVGSRKIGTFGDLAIFSFSQGKIISTGEGGAVVTNSKILFDSLKLIRSLGRREETDTTNNDQPFDFIQPGFNLRLSNILAALGVSQIRKVDKIIKKRSELSKYYCQLLADVPEIKLFKAPKENFSVHQMFPILADNRDGLNNYLDQHGIASRVFFKPVYSHYLYQHLYQPKAFSLPVTENISSKVLVLPFFPAMKKSDAKYVSDSIRSYYRSN